MIMKKINFGINTKQFNVDENEANKIYIEGKDLAENSAQLYGFTRIIKESWDNKKELVCLRCYGNWHMLTEN